MADLGLTTPTPLATRARAARPCDDPFCFGTAAACGWEPTDHTGRPQGGKTITVATPPVVAHRVLITGSRTWDDRATIEHVLGELRAAHGDRLVVVHGACPTGADALADAWCVANDVQVERYPADWNALGKGAGHARNQAMVDTRPAEVIAFNRDNSPGTSGCVAAARRAGLAVRPYEYAATAGVPAPTVPSVLAGPPPSTVKELRQVLIDYEAQRPRTMQKALGPSELGTPCQQQMARKLAGAPRVPITAPTWAPFQGTCVHTGMEEVVAFWNQQLGRERWLAEDRLEVEPALPGADGISGAGDAYDLDYQMVVDWKHTGKTARDKLARAKRMGKHPAEQVSAEYRVQGHLYGRGHERKGRPVRFVRLVLLARSHDYDESEEWTEAYNPEIAYRAINRYWETVDLVNALGGPAAGDAIAVVPAAPSRDACKWCPFYTPGRPATWQGCPGDRPMDKVLSNAANGLIA
jgi:hypothetical protein